MTCSGTWIHLHRAGNRSAEGKDIRVTISRGSADSVVISVGNCIGAGVVFDEVVFDALMWI